MKRIVLAMSGGVDSSTAAILLKQAGYEVVGCTMQLWDARRNPSREGRPVTGRCCSLDDVYDARRVAEHLGFPFYLVNLEAQFERRVVEPFIGSYLSGRTPIPCTLCNTFLKFDRLLLFARQVGVGMVATGHYARIRKDPDAGYQLLTGRDLSKDQSYYLFELSQDQLAATQFPIGEFEKEEIRSLASTHGLVTAGKPDSQEICFIPDGDHADFIRRHAGEVNSDFLPILRQRDLPGPILSKDGTQLGIHSGIHRFTVGQRRGLRIADPRPFYVMRIEPDRNAVIVGRHEDVFSSRVFLMRVNWIGTDLPENPVEAAVRIRSRHEPAAARIRIIRPSRGSEVEGISAEVEFCQPQLAVTPGQAAVFYQQERVLGGGWIESAA